MNWDQIEEQWRQVKWHHVKGHLQLKWAKLTVDDIQSVAGKKERLIDKLEQRYGVLREEATRQVDEWLALLSPGQLHR